MNITNLKMMCQLAIPNFDTESFFVKESKVNASIFYRGKLILKDRKEILEQVLENTIKNFSLTLKKYNNGYRRKMS